MTAAPPAEPGRTPFPAARVFAFGLPLVLGMGGHAFFNLVDLWIVGRLGAAALAAVTVASLVNTVPMVIMQGVTDGSVAVIARAVGAGDLARASAAARSSLGVALAMAVVLGVPPYLAAEWLAAALEASPASLPDAVACLEVLSLGSGTMFVLMQLCATLRAAGDGRAPAILLLGANLLNVFLSYGLVFGVFGLPELGVVGTAWGTVVARGIFGIVGFALLSASPLRVPLAGGRRFPGLSRILFRLGLPVAAQWLVRLVPVLIVLGIAGRAGTAAHAAYGIGGRLDTLVLFATVGWGAAAATAVGQGLGARDPPGAAAAAVRAAALGALTMGIGAVLYVSLAPDLVDLFARGEEGAETVRSIGIGYLRVATIGYPAVGVAVVLSLALTGAGSVKTSLAVDALVLVGIQVPLVFAAAPSAPGESLLPVWWVLAGTHWILAGAYAAVFGWGRWKRKQL